MKDMIVMLGMEKGWGIRKRDTLRSSWETTRSIRSARFGVFFALARYW